MKNKSLFLLTFFLAVPLVFSIPLENLTTPDTVNRLRASEDLIFETRFSNSSPVLIPSDNELRQLVSSVVSEFSPNIMVEMLYLYRKPQQSHTTSSSWNNVQKTGLFNQLLAISTMEGIQYYSASRGTMRTFFEYSRVIDRPNTKNPLPDPVFTVLPSRYEIYARQKDLTFGDNVYRYDFHITNGGIFLVQENVTALTLGIIPAIGRGNLKSIMAVFDCGDTLLIYSAAFAKSLSISSLNERIGSSFSNRAEAVVKWFAGRAETVFSR